MPPSPLNVADALSIPTKVAPLDTPIRSYSLEAFLGMEIPPKAMLLSPWLPEAGVSMIFAPRGIGKTYLALGISYAVATGGEFLRWRAPSPRRVLYVDGEMPAAAQQERWSALVASSPKDPPTGDYVRILASDLCEFGLPDLATTEGQRAIEPHIGDAALIVIDNLSTLARSGKENESESWGGIQDWALTQRRAGRSVLFVHHAGKGGDQRGTSKREDIMDSVLKLSLPSDYSPQDGARFNVEFTKSRGFYGDDAAAFEAALRDGVWSTKSLDDVRTARILELHAEGLNYTDIGQDVGCSKATVCRTLKRHKEAC